VRTGGNVPPDCEAAANAEEAKADAYFKEQAKPHRQRVREWIESVDGETEKENKD